MTGTPPDIVPTSPIIDERNWVPIATGVLAVLAVLVIAIWWLGIRDTSSEVSPVAVTETRACAMPIGAAGEMVQHCQVTASDARLSGTAVVTTSQPVTDLNAIDMTYELTNNGGTWEGGVIGTVNPDGSGTVYGVLLGSGDYEGLQYQFHGDGTTSDSGAVIEATGTIASLP